MRWDRLFDDLEGQLEQELRADELDQRAEEQRLRLGRLSLRDRLLALHEADADGRPGTLTVVLSTGDLMALRPTAFGRDWLAAVIDGGGSRLCHCILPLGAIASVLLTRAQTEASLAALPAEAAEHSLSARLTLPFVLRDLCRRRTAVDLCTAAGRVHGTIDRVGRDHLDLAVHVAGEPRRESSVSQYRVVPLAQLVLVRL